MDGIKQPAKQDVRDWMRDRQAEHTPPPEPSEVRRQLGWGLVKDEDPRDCAR